MNTSREQFVQDFTLVADNDFEMYDEIKILVHANDYEVAPISNAMKLQYEMAIGEALKVLRENWGIADVTVDLMSQILNGWGSDCFDDIARHYIEVFAEESTRHCGACGHFFDPRQADVEGYHLADKCEANN